LTFLLPVHGIFAYVRILHGPLRESKHIPRSAAMFVNLWSVGTNTTSYVQYKTSDAELERDRKEPDHFGRTGA
jgi:hypothetical protein